MKKFKISRFVILLIVLTTIGVPVVFAVSILPKEILELFDLLGPGGICAVQYVNSRLQFIMFLALGGLVLISVVYALIAAFKYIRSEGDPGEMEKAQKSIKAIFFGIGAMIIAIVGIVLVFVIFGAEPTNPELYQVCISAPQSPGCTACRENTDAQLCQDCEDRYTLVCNNHKNDETPANDQQIKDEIGDIRCTQ